MAKYHLGTKNGQEMMVPCKATTRACPLGGSEIHGDFADQRSVELYNDCLELQKSNNFKMGDLMRRAASGEPITERDMDKAVRDNRRFMRRNQDPNDPKYQQFLLDNGDLNDIRQVVASGKELDAKDLSHLAQRMEKMPDSEAKGQLGLDLMDKTYAVDEFENARDYAFHEGVVNGNWKNVGQVFGGTIRNERERRAMHDSREALAGSIEGCFDEGAVAEHQHEMAEKMRARQEAHKAEISQKADRFRSPKSMWKRRKDDQSLTPEQRREIDAAYMRIKDMEHSSTNELNRAMDVLYGKGVRPERTFATMKLLDRTVIRPARRVSSTPANQRGASDTPAQKMPKPRRASSTPRPTRQTSSASRPVGSASRPTGNDRPLTPPAPPAPAPGGRQYRRPIPAPAPQRSYSQEALRQAMPQARGYVNRASEEARQHSEALKAARERQAETEKAYQDALRARRAAHDQQYAMARKERALSTELFGQNYGYEPSEEDTPTVRRRRAVAMVLHPVKYANWRRTTNRKEELARQYHEAEDNLTKAIRSRSGIVDEVKKAQQEYENSDRRLRRATEMLDRMQIGDGVSVGRVGDGDSSAEMLTYDTNRILGMFRNLFD